MWHEPPLNAISRPLLLLQFTTKREYSKKCIAAMFSECLHTGPMAHEPPLNAIITTPEVTITHCNTWTQQAMHRRRIFRVSTLVPWRTSHHWTQILTFPVTTTIYYNTWIK
jgi:hypothetical protein